MVFERNGITGVALREDVLESDVLESDDYGDLDDDPSKRFATISDQGDHAEQDKSSKCDATTSTKEDKLAGREWSPCAATSKQEGESGSRVAEVNDDHDLSPSVRKCISNNKASQEAARQAKAARVEAALENLDLAAFFAGPETLEVAFG